MISFIFRVTVVAILLGALYLWYVSSDEEIVSGLDSTQIIQDSETAQDNTQIIESLSDLPAARAQAQAERTPKEAEKVEIPKKYSNDVPFVVQAPEAQWDDPRFQDACEEASLMMAHWWRTGKSATEGAVATKDFLNLFSFGAIQFGEGVIDTSAADTAKLMTEYYEYEPEVQTNITKNHILKAIASGALVIVPADGRKLDNKYFSGEGPERHMLVITGYDLGKDEFTVNEPGTRRGEAFTYDISNLMDAIGDYETGIKEPLEARAKNMIIVRKGGN